MPVGFLLLFKLKLKNYEENRFKLGSIGYTFFNFV